MWRVACFQGVSHVAVPKGRGPRVQKIFGTFFMRARSMRSNNQIPYGDQNHRCEEKVITQLTVNDDARSRLR